MYIYYTHVLCTVYYSIAINTFHVLIDVNVISVCVCVYSFVNCQLIQILQYCILHYITLRTHLNAGTINCDFRDWEKNREIKYPH